MKAIIALEHGRNNSLILPKSPLGKAISYTLGQWTALQRYLEEGVYEIDNNLVQNAIRPTCIGKNYAEIRIMRSTPARSALGPR
ncbi:MAG: hypothetical protein EXS25_07970 [Pedosphaera sp.]|nr:hypothetical protein [Pedosphaera sp.]